MIRIAIQSKGRLNEKSLKLLSDAGVTINENNRKLLTRSEDFPLEALFLRDDDIPQAVESGFADIGIVGMNEVVEKGAKVDIAHKLGFGRCRISLAIPKKSDYQGIEFFQGKRIATSYPRILSDFFDRNGVKAEICPISGSVEVTPLVGMADAIFDIVSSGSTLVSNGLTEVERVFDSEAVLIANKNLSQECRTIMEQMIFRFKAIARSKGMKYVMLNIPNNKIDEIGTIIHGMKSPTIIPLSIEGWSAVHIAVRETELWDKIEGLKSLGAEDILILALEKSIA